MKKLILLTFICFSFFTNAEAACSVTINPGNPAICIGKCVTLTATPTGTAPFTYTWSTGDTTPTITACPSTTKTYSVIITDVTSCTSSASTVITVNPLPVISASGPTSICIGDCATLSATGGISYSWIPCTSTNCSIVCPTATTTYTVIVTDGNGCTGSNSTTVNVNPLPFVYAGPDDTICYGGNAPLNGCSVATIYSWKPSIGLSNPNVCNPACNPTATTTYTLTATDANGCSNSDSITVFVHMITPLPTVYCSGDTLFVVPDSSYKSYQWYFNGWPIPGAIDSFYVSSQIGTYTVFIQDSYCTAFMYVCLNNGMSEIDDENLISLSPNPLTASCTLLFNSQLKDAEVIIYDMLGHEMMRKRMNGNKMEIEKGNLESGVYFVKVNAEEKQWVQKIIVE